MLFKDGLGDISEKAFKEFLHDGNIREQCAIHLRKFHLLPAYYVESITELLLDCSKTQFLDFRNGALDYDSWKSDINNCWISNPERCLQQTNDFLDYHQKKLKINYSASKLIYNKSVQDIPINELLRHRPSYEANHKCMRSLYAIKSSRNQRKGINKTISGI